MNISFIFIHIPVLGPPLWSYGSWIYNYLCNQCLSPLMLWVQISIRARCTTLCDKVCQWLATGRWFSPGPPVSSTNKTDRHDITKILLKVALNPIKQTNKQTNKYLYCHITAECLETDSYSHAVKKTIYGHYNASLVTKQPMRMMN